MPFDSETASLAGRSSGLARRRLILERADRAAVVGELVDTMERAEIGPKLLEMALNVSNRAAEADIEPTTPLELKQMIEAASTLHKMARLELGESTSNQARYDVGDWAQRRAELDARMAALAEEGQSPSA